MAKKIGIFGGSFNPPHIAHLIIAESIRDQFSLDQILWIPNYIPPHKKTAGAGDVQHRLRMVELAIEHDPLFSISTIELERKGTSYTLDTVRSLQHDNPAVHYYLIIGGDSLRDFMSWHKPLEIIDNVPLIVYNRTENNIHHLNLPSTVQRRISFASAPLLDLSSSLIRRYVANGNSIRYLVPEKVYSYIQEHDLYV